MPAAKTRDQGKTSFVKEVLIDNPLANTKAVNDAWSEAGMDGTISETLVNKMRARMGLTGQTCAASGAAKKGAEASTKRPSTGKKRGRKPSQEIGTNSERKTTHAATRSGKQNDLLVELEAELDRLLFRVMNLGELDEVESSLAEAADGCTMPSSQSIEPFGFLSETLKRSTPGKNPRRFFS